mmetsp:Transcript_77108/g.178862  ORF Transcript_77108/g.178862 Transcript_77108/m.178862 type:complete len:208 (-) Transcript_77108:280-903(-)
MDGKLCGALVSAFLEQLRAVLPFTKEVQTWGQETARAQATAEGSHCVVRALTKARDQIRSLTTPTAAPSSVTREVLFRCDKHVEHLDKVDKEQQRCGHPIYGAKAVGLQDASRMRNEGCTEVTQEPRQDKCCRICACRACRAYSLHFLFRLLDQHKDAGPLGATNRRRCCTVKTCRSLGLRVYAEEQRRPRQGEATVCSTVAQGLQI